MFQKEFSLGLKFTHRRSVVRGQCPEADAGTCLGIYHLLPAGRESQVATRRIVALSIRRALDDFEGAGTDETDALVHAQLAVAVQFEDFTIGIHIAFRDRNGRIPIEGQGTDRAPVEILGQEVGTVVQGRATMVV